jgi:hypothetical protein
MKWLFLLLLYWIDGRFYENRHPRKQSELTSTDGGLLASVVPSAVVTIFLLLNIFFPLLRINEIIFFMAPIVVGRFAGNLLILLCGNNNFAHSWYEYHIGLNGVCVAWYVCLLILKYAICVVRLSFLIEDQSWVSSLSIFFQLVMTLMATTLIVTTLITQRNEFFQCVEEYRMPECPNLCVNFPLTPHLF